MLDFYKKLSVLFFGGIADRSISSFKPLEPHLKKAKINILLKAWVSMIYFTTAVILVISAFIIYFSLLSQFPSIIREMRHHYGKIQGKLMMIHLQDIYSIQNHCMRLHLKKLWKICKDTVFQRSPERMPGFGKQ